MSESRPPLLGAYVALATLSVVGLTVVGCDRSTERYAQGTVLELHVESDEVELVVWRDDQRRVYDVEKDTPCRVHQIYPKCNRDIEGVVDDDPEYDDLLAPRITLPPKASTPTRITTPKPRVTVAPPKTPKTRSTR